MAYSNVVRRLTQAPKQLEQPLSLHDKVALGLATREEEARFAEKVKQSNHGS